MSDLTKETNDMAAQGLKEAKKSGQDWLKYVQTHPLQSMIFGLVAFFALKGMAK